jgi:hypothetical protein
MTYIYHVFSVLIQGWVHVRAVRTMYVISVCSTHIVGWGKMDRGASWTVVLESSLRWKHCIPGGLRTVGLIDNHQMAILAPFGSVAAFLFSCYRSE